MEIVSFARISDGSEINDNSVLQYQYQKHRELNKSNELELVALIENEEFCEYSPFSKLSITSTFLEFPHRGQCVVKSWPRYDVKFD